MSKIILSNAELLRTANERIRVKPGFMDGMQIVEAEMVNHVLFMHGECFINADGSATMKTAPALDFYNAFANEFAHEFTLVAHDFAADPASVAKDNVVFVVAQRLSNGLDAEQAKQSLEALNGSIKDE